MPGITGAPRGVMAIRILPQDVGHPARIARITRWQGVDPASSRTGTLAGILLEVVLDVVPAVTRGTTGITLRRIATTSPTASGRTVRTVANSEPTMGTKITLAARQRVATAPTPPRCVPNS